MVNFFRWELGNDDIKNFMKSHFYYDETSPSCLKVSRDSFGGSYAKKRGDNVGWICDGKYYYVYHEGKQVSAHRVVWELFYGPPEKDMQIDHIDGNNQNNKISNLRAVTPTLNKRNSKVYSSNKSGIPG